MVSARRARPSSSPDAAVPSESWKRAHTWALALIVLAAFGLRLAFWWGQSANNPFFSHPTLDEQTHHELAQAVATGQGVGAAPCFRAPLYYYLLGALYAIVGPNPLAARLLGCLLGTFSCYLIARLALALAGPAVGLLAGLIAALYWPMIFFDNQLQTASLEVLLDVLMMLLFVRGAQKGSWPLFLAAGLAWGLSAITRANILIIAPALLIALWLWPQNRSRRTPRRWLWATLLLAAAALPVSAVTVRNRVVGGEWVGIASSGGINFYIGNNPRSDGRSAIVPEIGYFWSGRFEGTQALPEAKAGRKLTHAEVSDFWFERATTWIRSNPADWVRLMWRKWRLFFSPLELPNDHPIEYFAGLAPVARFFWIGFPLVGVLGIAGLTLLGKNWRAWLLPLLFLPSYAAGIVLFFCPARFRLPVIPVLILLAAVGLVRGVQLLAARRFKPLAVYAGLGALAAGFIGTNPPNRSTFEHEEESAAHLQLGQFYAKAAKEDAALHEQAIRHLQRAAELQPDDWSVPRSLGACFIEMGLTEEACEQLSQAAQLSGNDPDNFYYLGTCLENVGRPEEAADAYRQALELLGRTAGRPEYLADLHHRLGRILAARRDYAAAITQFEQALRHNPNDTAALLSVGGALLELRHYDEAASRYRQLLAREPANVAALRSLAHALQLGGHAREALAVLAEAWHHEPHNVSVAGPLAWQLATSPDVTLRDGPRALQIVQQAIEAAGPNPTLLQALAAAYAECGRFDEAVTTAEQVLQMARQAGRVHEARWIEEQLALYRRNLPFRESE